MRDAVANGLVDFIKEKPFTSLGLLANKEVKEDNEQLKAQIEKMKCCENCKYGGLYSEGLYCYAPIELIITKQMNKKETCCDKWDLAE